MADMFDCGRYTRKSWREGAQHHARWLGPFDPTMTAEKAGQILEHDKLTSEGQAAFVRGWNADMAEHS